MNAKVSILKCNSYEPLLVEAQVRKAIDSLGGIVNFIKPQSKVLVKPNLLLAKGPESGVTTHPEVVRAVVRLLKDIGCEIFLGDGPSVWGNQIENVEQVYEYTGMKQLCLEEGVRLVDFDKRRMRQKFPLTTWIDDCAYLVNIPKFKTHDFTILTGAIKNLYGLVTGTYKMELHKNYFNRDDFAKILVDIYALASPALTVVDGILAMEGDGPGTSGKLRNLNLLLASADCVALDSVRASIMGLKPLDILSTKEAAHRGLGVSDMNYILFVNEQLKDVVGRPFLLPSTSIPKYLPRPVISLMKKLIKYYPYVLHGRCIRCQACVKACPGECIALQKGKIAFDYSRCIACFCCQEVCPSAAVRVRKSLLAKMIGL